MSGYRAYEETEAIKSITMSLKKIEECISGLMAGNDEEESTINGYRPFGEAEPFKTEIHFSSEEYKGNWRVFCASCRVDFVSSVPPIFCVTCGVALRRGMEG